MCTLHTFTKCCSFNIHRSHLWSRWMRMIVVVLVPSKCASPITPPLLNRSNCMCMCVCLFVPFFFLHSSWVDTVKNAFDYVSLSLSIILSVPLSVHIPMVLYNGRASFAHTYTHTSHPQQQLKHTHRHASIQLEFKIVVRPKNSYSQEKIFSSNRDLRRLTVPVPVRAPFPFSWFSLHFTRCTCVWTERKVGKIRRETKNKQSTVCVCTVAVYAIAVCARSSIKFSSVCRLPLYSCRGLISSYFAFICRGYIISVLAYFAIDRKR